MTRLAALKAFAQRQPLKTIGLIVGIWVLLGLGNLALLTLFPEALPDTPLWFPISLSSNPTLHLAGLPSAFLFLLLLWGAVREPRLSSGRLPAYLVGLALILLGNLIQGNADLAFRQPLYASNNQYYHDALKIDSWLDWLSTFNAHQSELLVHSKTHPPFAVLSHSLLINFLGDHPLQVGLVFVFVSSLALVLLGLIFDELGVSAENRNKLIILAAVIPAVNIYTAVSLDGVILMAGTLALFGLVRLTRQPKFSPSGAFFFVSGVLLFNLLTFTGVFFLAVGGLVGILEFFYKRKLSVLLATGLAGGLLVALLLGLNQWFHYDHLQAFFTASRIEDAYAFRGSNAPLSYLVSRFECVGEIALFFSIGCLAVLFHRDRLQLNCLDYRDEVARIALAAVATLTGLFLIGISHTGETARSWLTIYPFLLLWFYRSDQRLLQDLILLAGVQTALLQLVFSFFW